MALKSKANNKLGAGDQCPPGVHRGVCAAVIDLGTHWDSYRGQAERKTRRVWMVWEVEAEFKGKPTRFWLGVEYGIGVGDDGGLQMGLKSGIRQMLEGWRGKPYQDGEDIDPEAVLGRACQVNVIQDKNYAQVKAVLGLGQGQAPIKPTHAPLRYAAESQDGYPAPDWMPRVFGIKVEDYLENSLERKGSGRKEDLRKKQAAAGGGGNGQEPGDSFAGQDEIPF